MTKTYPAVFHFEDDGYWVEFPDLPGCFSEGSTVEEAIVEASAALGGTLASMLDRGVAFPPPSHPTDVTADGASFVSLVVADPVAFQSRTRAVKKTLTIPEWLNDAAERNHVNFSSVLQQALIAQLQ